MKLPALLTLVFVTALCACDKAPAPSRAEVKASKAYLEHFGAPPVPEKGRCYAYVGFLLMRDDPGKVRAVPLFLFSQEDHLQLLLDRLVSEEMALPEEIGFISPFPPGSEVRVEPPSEGAVTLRLSVPGPVTTEVQKAMEAVLTETAVQMEGINRVAILVNGTPLPITPMDGFFRHDPQRIAPAGAPLLLQVAGMWEQGADGPEEILANFDRPVTIDAFTMRDSDGREVEGEYFRSVFDMAVVIHPADPAAFRDETPLRVEWEVTDRLGRKGRNSGEFLLQRHDH